MTTESDKASKLLRQLLGGFFYDHDLNFAFREDTGIQQVDPDFAQELRTWQAENKVAA